MISYKNLDKEFLGRFMIKAKPHLKKTFINFIDIKAKACDLMRTDYDVAIFQSLILELRKTANFPYQCPFKKVKLFYVKN